MGKTMLVRVDREIWEEAKKALPKETGPTISRMLWNTSALRLEKKLMDSNFKNNIGETLYGKTIWKKFKK